MDDEENSLTSTMRPLSVPAGSELLLHSDAARTGECLKK